MSEQLDAPGESSGGEPVQIPAPAVLASPARPRNSIGSWGDSLGGSWRETGLADLEAKWDQ